MAPPVSRLAAVALSALLLPALASRAAAPPACCLFGGSGAATMLADGVLALPNAEAALTTVALGAGTAAGGEAFIAVLVGTQAGPEESVGGWIIAENATAQIFTVWHGPPSSPTCSRQSVALPGRFTPSVSLCVGSPDSAFPDFVGAYKMGSVGASWFGVNTSSSSVFAVTDAECAPVAVMGPATPFNTGAYSLTMQSGGPEPAPAAWGEAPAACGY